MKEKLSIGEFAKLRNITTETLRYYDRINLLKPIKVDPKTGYRYCSILQYEDLGTIKELRQLDMSIDEIKKYFNNRNLKQSVDILKYKHDELGNKIKEREIITFDKSINNEIELSYTCLELENSLKEIAPIVGSNRYGTIRKQANIEFNKYTKSIVMFIFIKDKGNINEIYIKKIPKGTYACMYYKESVWNIDFNLKKMIEYIEKQRYKVCGDIIQIIQIDVSVTDQSEEKLFEIQIPIKKY